MSLRIRIIQKTINLLECLFFYPRLMKFYQSMNLSGTITIIDVGANKGQSINFFLTLYPSATIYAFEPNKRLYIGLLNKYQAFPNVKILNLGVSNKNGKMSFHENILDETSSFTPVNQNSQYLTKKAFILGVKPDELTKSKYEVEVITLSEIFISKKITHVNILKIDVEGHESECIQGLIANDNTRVDLIQLEKHNDDMYLKESIVQDVPDMLTALEYNLIKTLKHPFGDFDEVVYAKS